MSQCAPPSVCLCLCSQTGLQPHYRRGVWLPRGQRRREDSQTADLGHRRAGAIPVGSQPLCTTTVFKGSGSRVGLTAGSLPTAPSHAATTEEPLERCWFTTLPGKPVASALPSIALPFLKRKMRCGGRWRAGRNPESSSS